MVAQHPHPLRRTSARPRSRPHANLPAGAPLVAGVVFLASGPGILTRPESQLATFCPPMPRVAGPVRAPPRAGLAGRLAAAALGYVAADLLTGTSLPTTLRLTAANPGQACWPAIWYSGTCARKTAACCTRCRCCGSSVASAAAAVCASLVGRPDLACVDADGVPDRQRLLVSPPNWSATSPCCPGSCWRHRQPAPGVKSAPGLRAPGNVHAC